MRAAVHCEGAGLGEARIRGSGTKAAFSGECSEKRFRDFAIHLLEE